MIKAILWDIDNTLLDFEAAEAMAMRNLFARYQFGSCTEAMLARYSAINKRYWARLERRELTREAVLIGRFREFFQAERLDERQAEGFNQDYQLELGECCVFMDEADSLLRQLNAEGYRQYAVTNGTARAQKKKLRRSGLERLLDDCFISEYLNYDKPSPKFFELVFERIPERRRECLLVGDSLSSDILGAANAGVLSCWYNPKHGKNHTGIHPDYELDDLRKLPELLKKL